METTGDEKTQIFQQSVIKADDYNDTTIENVHAKVNKLAPITKLTNKKVKITQQIIEESYNKLKVIIDDREVNAATITILVTYAVHLSNELLDANKQYKIELTLAMLRKLIDDKVENPAERMAMHMMVESTVPAFISSISGLPNVFKRILKKCGCFSQ
jgi:hypothetical protein